MDSIIALPESVAILDQPPAWECWQHLLSDICSASKSQEVREFPGKFLGRLEEASKDLYIGKGGLTLTEDETDVIQDQLFDGLPTRLRKIAQHVFRIGLDKGNS